VRLLPYIVVGFIAVIVAGFFIAAGQTYMPRPLMALAFVALFVIPPIGALWMMYLSIRYEQKPLPLVLLALFVPLSFLWYYFERVRLRKLTRNHALL